MAVSTNKKCKIRSKVVTRGSRDTLFGILGPPNISGTNEAKTSSSAHIWTAVRTNEKNAKLGHKGLCGVT